jgi:hypothetical protein
MIGFFEFSVKFSVKVSGADIGEPEVGESLWLV